MAKKEIYIVTAGAYSDYSICAVFTKKEQAELYCAVKRYDDMNIEEWETDVDIIKTDKKPLRQWTMMFAIDTNMTAKISDRGLTLKEEKKVLKGRNEYQAIITTAADCDEGKATKIMYDYIAEWKYNYFMEKAAECKKGEGNA